ncbi:DUF6088 family protein, partial [Pseudomonas aeruginosa]|uniref:DUF6088 family protein n=1 Tax=Pseudomonas aeruginosa TaxID=287 RepID=UPI003982E4B1
QWNITVQVLVESVSKWPWNECPSQRGLGVQVRMESPANAVRRFGLSTQMPLITIYYTNGASRSVFIGKAEVRLVHAAPMVMQHAGTEVGMAISALFYLGKEGATSECIAAIKKGLKPEDLAKLMTCRMPKWMRMTLEFS